MKRQIIILGCLLLAAGLAHAQECSYVETPWGGSCAVDVDKCSLVLVPMFVDTDNRLMYVKMITEEGEAETVADFTDTSVIEFKYEWTGSVRWIEWFARGPAGEYPEVPYAACYCDEVRQMVVMCVMGEVDQEWAP